MPKKRIMVLGMSPNVGGVETYIMNWLRTIDRRQYEFYFPYYNKIAYEKELIELDGKLINLKVSRHTPLRYYLYLKKLFKKYKFDVVYYNTCDIMSMDMIMMGKKCNVPVRIIHSHNSSNINPPNLLHRFTEKWCRNHLDQFATHLLACSDVAGKWMFDGRPFEIVKNGIDTNKFKFNEKIRSTIRDKYELHQKFVVGFVGSLWAQKNPLFLMDVFEEVQKIKENAVLMIVGDGELKEQMQQKAEKAGITDKVFFMGICSNVNELMNAMDCFLLPSKFEGLPFVLVEAQTNGLKCITSTNVSQESNITGEVSFVSLEEKIELWANTIINSQVKYSRDNYSTIVQEQKYDILSTVERLSEIFASV